MTGSKPEHSAQIALIVTPQYLPMLGGMERECALLAEQFLRLGYEPMVITEQFGTDFPAEQMEDGVKVIRINSSAQGKKRHIISSIDRFHPISGLKNKLLAYQKFMRDFPPFRPITCLVQYVVVSEGAMHLNTAEYTQTRSEIQALIKEIEEEFGKGAIHYQE